MALTVTATASGAEAVDFTGLVVQVLNNASYVQNGATASSVTVTTPQLAITPHATGNMIYAAVVTGASSGGFSSPNANTTSLMSVPQTGAGSWTVGAYRSTSTTTVTTSVTYGFTAPTEATNTILIACAEIVANGTIGIDASTPAAVSTTTSLSVTTASFTPPGAAVLVACVSTPWATNGTVNIALSDSASAYNWTQLVTAAISGGNLATTWVGIPKNPPVTTVASPPRLIAPGWTAPSALTRRMPGPPAPPVAPILQGQANLSGSGSLGASETIIVPGSAGLSGNGSLGATGLISGAQLSGVGSLGATPNVIIPGAAGLTGSGSLGAAGAFGGSAGLDGEGLLGAHGAFAATAGLTGTGTLAISGEVLGFLAQLSGVGSLGAFESVQYAALTGIGTLAITGEKLGFVSGLSGVGSLSIPQVAGGLVNGIGGGSTPQALPGASQVAVAPPGSGAWQWVGTLGHVTALTYSFVCPGGCDKMSLTLEVPAAYRTQLFNPGWQVKITRGGHQVWYGKLDEPQPSASGWTLTAVGAGNLGQNFVNYYTSTWPTSQPDQIVNDAIGRGLPWTNPGWNGASFASQYWFGQEVDPGSATVTDLLNLICTRGGLTWYVNSQPGGPYNSNDLTIFPLPTVPNRLLVCTTPIARTLGGDINTIVAKYMTAADNTTTNTAATYSTAFVQNAPSEQVHQVMETYIDLSDAGVMTLSQVQQVCNYIFQIYQRASFAGPFSASYGQLLNLGGQAIDPGTDQAGTMIKLILTDFGYGGEVTPQFPVTFIVGAYSWDDFAQTATITPYQTVDQSLTGLLSLENTILTPITAATSS